MVYWPLRKATVQCWLHYDETSKKLPGVLGLLRSRVPSAMAEPENKPVVRSRTNKQSMEK